MLKVNFWFNFYFRVMNLCSGSQKIYSFSIAQMAEYKCRKERDDDSFGRRKDAAV